MFVLAAWFFRSVAVISDVPVFSTVFVFAALSPVLGYLRHYARFAKGMTYKRVLMVKGPGRGTKAEVTRGSFRQAQRTEEGGGEGP